MSLHKALVWLRARMVPALLALLLGATAVVFRNELSAWFSGQPLLGDDRAKIAPSVEAGPFQVAATFSPDPPRQKGNVLSLVIRDGKGKPIEGAETTVRYRMPPMGSMREMRGDAEVVEQSDGRYDAKFDLPMGGSWELSVGVHKGELSGEAQFNMTVGSKGLTPRTSTTKKTNALASGRLPAYEFENATLERLRAAFAAYEKVRSLLAKDQVDGIDGQAAQAKASLETAASGEKDLPAPIRNEITEGAKAAERLGRANDAAQARESFGELSRHLVALAKADRRLTEGLQIFMCPMTKGYKKWFQSDDRLENPYMGQKMPECGSRSQWQTAEATTIADGVHLHDGDDRVAYYTCSMHPSVKQDGPGKCPICGMDLTPVTKQEVETGTIFVDEVRRQRIGVRTDEVKKRPMMLEVRAVGAVRYDETRLHDVNLRMSGWVERLFVSETGQRVGAGQTLFTLYSPELYAAQLEHLTGVRRRQAEGAGEMLAQLSHASRMRLKLLGMSDQQIAALEERGEAEQNVPISSPASGYVIDKQIVQGARVEAGMRVYRIADLSKIWIDAEVYESDLSHVRIGQAVEVELPYMENKRYPGKVNYIYPTLEGQTRTGRARIVLHNPKLELRPDMYANVFIQVDLGERLTIPDSAVIYTGPRRLVFVDLGEGKLQPKAIKLGVHVDGLYEVIDGLSEGQVVVTSGNFLIAAESRIRSAARYWESPSGTE